MRFHDGVGHAPARPRRDGWQQRGVQIRKKNAGGQKGRRRYTDASVVQEAVSAFSDAALAIFCSSPFWNNSRVMSQPPISSPSM